MGKYMRKAKLISDVSGKEISKSTNGVRTRAKTRLQSSKPDYCYLQLRSRRLEKPPQFFEQKKQTPKVKQSTHESRNCCSVNQTGSRGLTSGSIGSARKVEIENRGSEEEQFGENNMGFEPIESAIRESSPCNLIKDVDSISTPGSSTRYPKTAENQGPRSSNLTNIPSTRELDEFFAHFEQQQQRLFMDKYNFDIINDMPLPGRYEWVKVNP